MSLSKQEEKSIKKINVHKSINMLNYILFYFYCI